LTNGPHLGALNMRRWYKRRSWYRSTLFRHLQQWNIDAHPRKMMKIYNQWNC